MGYGVLDVGAGSYKTDDLLVLQWWGMPIPWDTNDYSIRIRRRVTGLAHNHGWQVPTRGDMSVPVPTPPVDIGRNTFKVGQYILGNSSPPAPGLWAAGNDYFATLQRGGEVLAESKDFVVLTTENSLPDDKPHDRDEGDERTLAGFPLSGKIIAETIPSNTAGSSLAAFFMWGHFLGHWKVRGRVSVVFDSPPALNSIFSVRYWKYVGTTMNYLAGWSFQQTGSSRIFTSLPFTAEQDIQKDEGLLVDIAAGAAAVTLPAGHIIAT